MQRRQVEQSWKSTFYMLSVGLIYLPMSQPTKLTMKINSDRNSLYTLLFLGGLCPLIFNFVLSSILVINFFISAELAAANASMTAFLPSPLNPLNDKHRLTECCRE